MSLNLVSHNHVSCTEIIIEGSPLSEQDFKPLHDQVNKLIEMDKPNIVLNLEKINLLNSLGLNTLIKVFTKCRNNGGDMYIVNISDKINQVLLLTKLNTVLNIAPALEVALENFQNQNNES